MQSFFGRHTPLFLALTGMLALSACTDDAQPGTERLAAFTPTLGDEASDPLAGMSLLLDASRQAAAIELEDGTLVDLELGASQLEGDAAACQGAAADGDRHVMEVLTRPLTVGDRTFDAPVLETGCSIEAPSGPTLLREADAASCEGGECISFATPDALETWRDVAEDDADQGSVTHSELPLATSSGVAAFDCEHSNVSCQSCGSGYLRTRTVKTLYHTNQYGYQWCTSTVSYGTCGSCAV